MEIQKQKIEILLVHGLRNETANKVANCDVQMPAEGRVIASLLSTT